MQPAFLPPLLHPHLGHQEVSQEQLGQRLSQIIQDVASTTPARGWKQQLAGALEISPSYLTKMLTPPPPNVSREVIETVCRRIGLRLDYFLAPEDLLQQRLQEMRDLIGDESFPFMWSAWLHRPVSRNLGQAEKIRLAAAAVEGLLSTEQTERSASQQAELTWAAMQLVKALKGIRAIAAAEAFAAHPDESRAAHLAAKARTLSDDLYHGVNRFDLSGIEAFDAVAGTPFRQEPSLQ